MRVSVLSETCAREHVVNDMCACPVLSVMCKRKRVVGNIVVGDVCAGRTGGRGRHYASAASHRYHETLIDIDIVAKPIVLVVLLPSLS